MSPEANTGPRRNSKLTMLLQDSLGGDSKALMFCNVAPVAVHAADTFSSLAFASKVRTVSSVLLVSTCYHSSGKTNQKKTASLGRLSF